MFKVMFINEVISFYNKLLRYGFLIFIIIIGLIGTLLRHYATVRVVLILLVIYGLIGLYSLYLYNKKMYFIKNGRSAKGKIVDYIKRIGFDHEDMVNTTNIYMLIEYKNPYTKKNVKIQSKEVIGNTNKLRSDDVTIYTLEDGRYLITDLDL